MADQAEIDRLVALSGKSIDLVQTLTQNLKASIEIQHVIFIALMEFSPDLKSHLAKQVARALEQAEPLQLQEQAVQILKVFQGYLADQSTPKDRFRLYLAWPPKPVRPDGEDQ